MIKSKKKPVDIISYKRWLRESLNVKITNQTKNYYQSIVNLVKSSFERSDIWRYFIAELQNYSDEYSYDTNDRLLSAISFNITIKNFDSFLEKTFRMNIQNNNEWPDKPKKYGEWVTEPNWFNHVCDPVRTMIVVKYLDGVKFLVEKLSEACNKFHIEYNNKYEAKEDGYYGAHFYITHKCTIPSKTWSEEEKTFKIEIQITTQIQEVIRNMLHRYYAKRKINKIDAGWKWDFEKDEFSTNYLGHVLHYIEANIVKSRDEHTNT